MLLAGTAVAVLAGCGSVGHRSADAAGAARGFYGALARGDGDTACALLAPGTREEVMRNGPCPQALRDAGVPAEAGRVRKVEVYGDQAQVVSEGDTAFLTLVAGRWRIVAAGCTPRGERPYRCVVDG